MANNRSLTTQKPRSRRERATGSSKTLKEEIMKFNRSLAMCAIAALVIGFAGTTANAASAISHYTSVRPVLTVPAQEELAAVSLDTLIWAASPGSPPDIRFADAAGVPIPHLLQKAAEQRLRTVRDQCHARIDALQEQPDNRIELTVTLDDKAPFATEIEFMTPLMDFERQITVQGIDAEGSATLLVENALIYDYARFADVRRCTVPLPPNRFRRFAIAIGNVTDEQQSPRRQISRTYEQGSEVRMIDQGTLTARPFRMDAVQLYAERQAESHRVDREIPIPTKSWKVLEKPREQQTVIEIETHNEPVTGFTLQVADRNFTRRIRVEVPAGNGGGDTWRTIGSASLSRIAFRNLLQEDRRLVFPECRSLRFRLIIENQDNPPLDITAVEAFGPLWQALYLAAPGRQARLFYGAATPSAPARHDTEAIRRVVGSGFEPIPFNLGDPSGNPDHRQSGLSLTGLVGSRAFFIGAVVIMIAVMAAALVKATRRLD
jgi:hypothetical protein